MIPNSKIRIRPKVGSFSPGKKMFMVELRLDLKLMIFYETKKKGFIVELRLDPKVGVFFRVSGPPKCNHKRNIY